MFLNSDVFRLKSDFNLLIQSFCSEFSPILSLFNEHTVFLHLIIFIGCQIRKCTYFLYSDNMEDNYSQM